MMNQKEYISFSESVGKQNRYHDKNRICHAVIFGKHQVKHSNR